MNKIQISFVFLLNIIIAFGFYYWNLNAKIEDISSDLANIIPVCKKIDNPNLFENDLYLTDINDVAYYTPFFVQPLRFFAKFVDYDYLQALNLMSFFSHFFYGIFWFFLFYKLKKEYWIALLFSLFMRGVIWPPGGELLGISDLWTIMPRTLYTVFLPLPFLIYNPQKKINLILAAFVLGFIFNFHAISGLGGIVIYFSLFLFYHFYQQGIMNLTFVKQFSIAVFFCIVGMLPFLMTYFFNVENNLSFSQADFNLAFSARIPSSFSNPILFISKWNRPVIYLFGLLFFIYYFFDSSVKKNNFKLLLFAVVVLFVAANGSVYIEKIINNSFDKNLRMSFQLIRFQKLIIVVLQVGLFLFTIELIKYFKVSNKFKIITFSLYFFILTISTFPFFSSVPFVGDDLTTSVLPKNMKFYSESKPEYELTQMIDYIKFNTEKEAVFYGTYLIRAGADRAVVLDSKGASMLIEGNPIRFIEWYYDLKMFRSKDSEGKLAFLKSKKVSYIMDDKVWEGLRPIKIIGSFYLYKI